jgi:energy-coupling factor transporter ATP-binding protein EcfA2
MDPRATPDAPEPARLATDGDQPAGASPGPGPEPQGEDGKDAPRLRLRSLTVHSFRDVRPGTQLSFGDGFHLILGKNASGKSTLLELLAAVSALDFRGPFFAETPFHLEASFEVGKVSLHAEVRRTFEPQRIQSVGDRHLDLPPRDEAEVVVRVEHPEVALRQWWQIRTGEDPRIFTKDPRQEKTEGISFRLAGQLDPLGSRASRALSLGAVVLIDGTYRVHPEVWPAIVKLSDYPGTGAPFDEALGALQAMVGGGLTVVRGPRFRSISPWLPPALGFDAQGEPVTCNISLVPLLRSAVEQLGYDDAKAYFGPGASVARGWSYASPSFQFFRRGTAVRRHDQLSFGQQRLFSFAWYLACNPDVAIADELVNGLHAEWIDWCVDAIGDRQCFLTSQNPILVDAVPFGSEEDLRRGIILCEASTDAAGDTTELSWRQLDDREVGLIWGALQQSRLDLLSDLLHALDLW